MPVNSELLKSSISKCYSDFLRYFGEIRNFLQLSFLFWKDSIEWSEIEKVEFECNSLYCKNILDLEWHCTKNAPSATKLRFFLALFLCAKDLERCGDYLYSLSKIAKKKEDKEFRNIVLSSQLWETVLRYFENIYLVFHNSKGKIHQSIFHQILLNKNTVHSKFSDISSELNNQLLSLSLNLEDQNEYTQEDKIREIVGLSRAIQLVLVKMDRLLDHSFNIVENFYYIKNQEWNLNFNSLLGESHYFNF